MSTETVVTVATTGLDAKRAEAKAYLGQRWVLHPEYVPDPRHSNNPETYQRARDAYTRQIAVFASAARTNNPDYHRACNLREQIGH